MRDAAFWQEFAERYALEEPYWYIPKGFAIRLDNEATIRDRLRVLQGFEGRNWGRVQRNYARELRRLGLFTPRRRGGARADRAAIARMVKTVFGVLGFAWVDEQSSVFITSTGKEFLSKASLELLVRRQLLKYQFYNPSLATKFRTARLFPHVFLARILLALSDHQLTRDEYVLFVCRAKMEADFEPCVENIERFRLLNQTQRQDVLRGVGQIRIRRPRGGGPGGQRRTTMLRTVSLNYAYAINFFAFSQYMEHRGQIVSLRRNSLSRVQDIVKRHMATAVFVDFDNEKDWFAFYGDFDKESGYRPAREYYEDKSKIAEAVNLLREANQRKLVSVLPEESEYVSPQIKEKILEDFLEYRVDELEPGLTLLDRQFSTPVGPIDLLARDRSRQYVVVELKKGRSSDKVFGQTMRYVGWIRDNLETRNRPVRAIIVARSVDHRLRYCVRALQQERVDLKEYDFRFRFRPVPA